MTFTLVVTNETYNVTSIHKNYDGLPAGQEIKNPGTDHLVINLWDSFFFAIFSSPLKDYIGIDWFFNIQATPSGTLEAGWDTAQVRVPWDKEYTERMETITKHFQNACYQNRIDTGFVESWDMLSPFFVEEYKDRNNTDPFIAKDHLTISNEEYATATATRKEEILEEFFENFRVRYNTYVNRDRYLNAEYDNRYNDLTDRKASKSQSFFLVPTGEFGATPDTSFNQDIVPVVAKA